MRRAALATLALVALVGAACSTPTPAASVSTAAPPPLVVPTVLRMTGSAAVAVLEARGFTDIRIGPTQATGDMPVKAQSPIGGTSASANTPMYLEVDLPIMTTSPAPAPAPAPVPAPAPAPAPARSFSDGTYEVGGGVDEIPAGKYKSTGPDGSLGVCYYARMKNNDGSLGDIIANDVSEGPSVLTVKASDGYVKIQGCTFTRA